MSRVGGSWAGTNRAELTQIWTARVPVGRLLKGMAGTAEERLGQMRSDELHAERQATLGKTTGQRNRRTAGEIEGHGEAHQPSHHRWIHVERFHFFGQRHAGYQRRDEKQVYIPPKMAHHSAEMPSLTLSLSEIQRGYFESRLDERGQFGPIFRGAGRIAGPVGVRHFDTECGHAGADGRLE